MLQLNQYFLTTYTMTYVLISPKLYIKLHNDYKRRDLFELAAKSEHDRVLWSAAAVVLLIRRQPWQEQKSSEVIFVILLVAAASPSGRGFPRCLISYINHTIFMTITWAAVASVLQGSSVENIDWRLNWAAENKLSRSGTEWEMYFHQRDTTWSRCRDDMHQRRKIKTWKYI